MTEDTDSEVERDRREIDMLKRELMEKNREIKSIKDQLARVEKDINSLKQDRMDLLDRVKTLTKKVDREIDERREADVQESAKLTKHVDKEIAAVTKLLESNRNELATETKSLQDDIRSIKTDIYYMKSQILLIQAPSEKKQFDARYDWVIDGDVGNTKWGFGDKTSGYFTGAVHPYKYRLTSLNGIDDHSVYNYIKDFFIDAKTMFIWLCIHPSPNDGQLEWPFEARVDVTVTDKERIEACSTISRWCSIARPDNACGRSKKFVFHHSELIEAGIDLSRGVRVSCVIFPD